MRKTSFLIVDDEQSIRETIGIYFSQLGATTYLAGSSEEALEIANRFGEEIDIVFTDINMPGGQDGIYLLREIKKQSLFTQVIILTGYPNIGDAVTAMEEGAFTYICKPYQFAVLQHAATKARLRKQELKGKFHEEMKKENLAELGTLIGGLAHNMVSPIQSILASAELIRPEAEHSSTSRHLKTIISAAYRMRSYINTLLLKVRDGLSEEVVSFSLNEMISNELEVLEADPFFRSKVSVKMELTADLPKVKGIYVDFSQTFLNIVINAIHAMVNSPQKNLYIRSFIRGSWIVIEVRDTGCGIKKEDIGKIFLPTFTTKSKLNENSGEPVGTGMGLFNASQIIRCYQGEIEVESQQGETSFFIKIPLMHAATETAMPAQKKPRFQTSN